MKHDGVKFLIRPGQITPNEFEVAILEKIATENSSLRRHLGLLHVLSREFTGVGSYTKFRDQESGGESAEQQFGLDGLILMPNVPNGMGAILFCRGGWPKCLETYTFGNELWDGVFDGFSITASSNDCDE
jgi:hypothetical protein